MMNGFISSNDDSIHYFKILLAGKKIEIECFNKYVFYVCRDYLSSFDKPDLIIGASLDEIHKEALKTVGEDIYYANQSETIAVEYVQTESTLILRKIADALIADNVLLIHGAAIAIEEKCYIFTAESGTGKTTHIKNWLAKIPGTIVVNGDKPFVDVKRGIVYGSPWCGKEGMNTNIAVPLAGIIALERGESNIIQEINFGNLLPTLLQQTYIPTSERPLKGYQLLAKLSGIPCYRLFCNMNVESAVVAYNELCKKTHDKNLFIRRAFE